MDATMIANNQARTAITTATLWTRTATGYTANVRGQVVTITHGTRIGKRGQEIRMFETTIGGSTYVNGLLHFAKYLVACYVVDGPESVRNFLKA